MDRESGRRDRGGDGCVGERNQRANGDADKSPLRLEIVPGGRVSYCFRTEP